MGQTGKIAVAAVVSAVSGFIIGLVFYALRVGIQQSAPWDHQANVALAMRAGILSAVLVFFILYRKIRSS
jgi:hypothetical protein